MVITYTMKLCRTKQGQVYNVFTITDLYHATSNTLCSDAVKYTLLDFFQTSRLQIYKNSSVLCTYLTTTNQRSPIRESASFKTISIRIRPMALL